MAPKKKPQFITQKEEPERAPAAAGHQAGAQSTLPTANLEVKRVNYRRRYYLAALKPNGKRDMTIPMRRWTPIQARQKRETYLKQSIIRKTYTARPGKYKVEKLRNTKTGKEYYLKYRNIAERDKVLKKFIRGYNGAYDETTGQKKYEDTICESDLQPVSLAENEYKNVVTYVAKGYGRRR